MSTVTEIAPDVFRITTPLPDFGIQLNQYLVRDDEPFLMHAGYRGTFAEVKEAVATLIDPADLRWIGMSHFESDEAGALNDWLALAPRSTGVASTVGAMVNLSDFAIRPARALTDNEAFSIGTHTLKFLSTPHVPHAWDAGHFFETTDKTLFCSDLFFHGGNPKPIEEGDVLGPAEEAIKASRDGPLRDDIAWTEATPGALERMATLEPATLALMHGSTYRGDGAKALRELSRAMERWLGNGETPTVG